jgi:hypothetical protein
MEEFEIEFPSRLRIARSWKTLIAVLLVGLAAFSVGVFANRVVVQQVQSIGGNHVNVPAPELQVLNTVWNTELNRSIVTGLLLNVTTTGAPGQTGSKLYHIDVQVSCLPTTATSPRNCAFGSTLVTLPVNMNGTAVMVPVAIAPAIDPEIVEIDDLSFIVTGSPADLYMTTCYSVFVFPYCYTIIQIPTPQPPDFFLFAPNDIPVVLHCGQSITGGQCAVSTASLTKVVQSFNGYTGTVTLSANAPPGLVATIVPVSQLVPPGGSVPYTETISTTPTTLLGNYLVVNVATDGSLTHIYGVMVHVVP